MSVAPTTEKDASLTANRFRSKPNALAHDWKIRTGHRLQQPILVILVGKARTHNWAEELFGYWVNVVETLLQILERFPPPINVVLMETHYQSSLSFGCIFHAVVDKPLGPRAVTKSVAK